MHLQQAKLWYGARPYEVKADDHQGLPLVFDFEHPVECAQRVLMVMSQASGGHPLHDCRVLVHRGRHTASVSANGASVHYAPRERSTTLTAEQALEIMAQTITYQIGTVYPRMRRVR